MVGKVEKKNRIVEKIYTEFRVDRKGVGIQTRAYK